MNKCCRTIHRQMPHRVPYIAHGNAWVSAARAPFEVCAHASPFTHPSQEMHSSPSCPHKPAAKSRLHTSKFHHPACRPLSSHRKPPPCCAPQQAVATRLHGQLLARVAVQHHPNSRVMALAQLVQSGVSAVVEPLAHSRRVVAACGERVKQGTRWVRKLQQAKMGGQAGQRRGWGGGAGDDEAAGRPLGMAGGRRPTGRAHAGA